MGSRTIQANEIEYFHVRFFLFFLITDKEIYSEFLDEDLKRPIQGLQKLILVALIPILYRSY